MYWESLAFLTGLHMLRLIGLDWDSVGGIMALSCCRQLTRLNVAAPTEVEPPNHIDLEVSANGPTSMHHNRHDLD